MAKLLLADPDPARAADLAAALGTAGHDVTVAPSGSYALTMLERGRPDLIVTRNLVDDMDGAELTAVVRADPAAQTIPMMLLDDGSAADVPDVDLVLDGASNLSVILTCIENVLGVHRRTPSPPPVAPRPAPATGLRGSLTVMDLPEVAQAIALGTKTGRLNVTLSGGPGTIVFDGGRVVHAEYGTLNGLGAFAALVREARAGGDFSFTAADRADVRGITPTIQGSVERLLLSIASDIDDAGAVTTGSTHVEGS
jgi:CheY-like chemotaxis protein